MFLHDHVSATGHAVESVTKMLEPQPFPVFGGEARSLWHVVTWKCLNCDEHGVDEVVVDKPEDG